MSAWVRTIDIPGGLSVFCRLCGRKDTKRNFYSVDTNYAEARRLATAYHWNHEHSGEHAAAIAAFHSPSAPEVTNEQRLLCSIFGTEAPDEMALRRTAAKAAFRRAGR